MATNSGADFLEDVLNGSKNAYTATFQGITRKSNFAGQHVDEKLGVSAKK